MAGSMPRSKEEALKNLKLDHGFIAKMMRDDGSAEAGQDFDIFLMETNVMPLLLQGLDALSRHIDKIEKASCISGGSKAPFNPLRWLAQYLLRNHPVHVQDHRTPMYQQLSNLALIERGRRNLLRRKPQIEEVFREMEKETFRAGRPGMTNADLPQLFQTLDEDWGLEGELLKNLPRDFREVQGAAKGGSTTIGFVDFWKWFEPYVSSHDVIRAVAFDEAEHRRREVERQAQREQEDALLREQALQEVLELRRDLEQQFQRVIIDVYVNEVIGRILNKGVLLQGVEEKEECPLKGEHIALLVMLLGLWGCPIPADSPEDEWNSATLAAWNQWLEESGPQGAVLGQVDSASLKALLDRDSFQEYLIRAHPVGTDAADEGEVQHTVEVKNIFEEGLDMVVEAIDDETGETLQLALPDNQAEEVRRRLDAHQGPLLARVDLVSARVMSLLPPPVQPAQPAGGEGEAD